jgi:hypothetical protein
MQYITNDDFTQFIKNISNYNKIQNTENYINTINLAFVFPNIEHSIIVNNNICIKNNILLKKFFEYLINNKIIICNKTNIISNSIDIIYKSNKKYYILYDIKTNTIYIDKKNCKYKK